jgi:hypothetical protein
MLIVLIYLLTTIGRYTLNDAFSGLAGGGLVSAASGEVFASSS